MSLSTDSRSVIVVGVIFLVALGSVVYLSYSGGGEDTGRPKGWVDGYTRGSVVELDSHRLPNLTNATIYNAYHLNAAERKSIIDCENMVPEELQTPRFLGSIPNITVTKGDNVSVPCVIENLGTFRMAWLKLHSQTILTIHNHIITKNMRIGLSIDLQSLETPCKKGKVETSITMYTLHITSVQENDGGFYMCQMNTDPMKGQWGYLKVLTPSPSPPPSSLEAAVVLSSHAAAEATKELIIEEQQHEDEEEKNSSDQK